MEGWKQNPLRRGSLPLTARRSPDALPQKSPESNSLDSRVPNPGKTARPAALLFHLSHFAKTFHHPTEGAIDSHVAENICVVHSGWPAAIFLWYDSYLRPLRFSLFCMTHAEGRICLMAKALSDLLATPGKFLRQQSCFPNLEVTSPCKT